MNREILLACLPCLYALLGASAVLLVIVRHSSASWNWSRLRQVHTCERGSVQSLSLVVTLPIFILMILFIIQVSQLMVGIIVVHYAAFAGARAASVWIPAYYESEAENQLFARQYGTRGDSIYADAPMQNAEGKLLKIQQAVVMACAPIAPSRELVSRSNPTISVPTWVAESNATTARLYAQITRENSNANNSTNSGSSRFAKRLYNKLAYASVSTQVRVEWQYARHYTSDRYNDALQVTYNPLDHPDIPWIPGEVGWEDPITVRVVHNYALLSGVGKFIAARLVPADGSQDNISPKIKTTSGSFKERVYSIEIPASATIYNEGFKSILPYQQRRP